MSVDVNNRHGFAWVAGDFRFGQPAQRKISDVDLVITQDILLAHMLVTAAISVIDPRGKKYTEDNIGQIVSTRNLMQGLRDEGEITGGSKQFGDRERRAFAAVFDKELTRLLRQV